MFVCVFRFLYLKNKIDQSEDRHLFHGSEAIDSKVTDGQMKFTLLFTLSKTSMGPRVRIGHGWMHGRGPWARMVKINT